MELKNAIVLHDYAKIECLLAQGFSVNRIQDGLHPITVAAKTNDLHTVKLLMYNGAHPVKSALTYAVVNSNTEMVDLLMNTKRSVGAKRNPSDSKNLRNAKLTIKDKHAFRLYERAILNLDIDMIVALARNGININAFDRYGVIPLFLAVDSANLEIVETFIKNGANINHKSIQGETCIYYTVRSDRDIAKIADILSRLLDYNFDVLARDAYNNTLLHYAVCSRNLEWVKTIISYRIPIDAKNINDETPLKWAVVYGAIDVAKLLISYGANMYIVGEHEMLAVIISEVQFILAAGIINRKFETRDLVMLGRK